MAATARSTEPPIHIRTQPYRERAHAWSDAANKWADDLVRELSAAWHKNDALESANKSFLDDAERLKLEIAELRKRPDPVDTMAQSRQMQAELRERVAALEDENDDWIEQVQQLEQQVDALRQEVTRLSTPSAEAPTPPHKPAHEHDEYIGTVWRMKKIGTIVRVMRLTGAGQFVVRVDSVGSGTTTSVGKTWHIQPDIFLATYERIK